MKTKKVAINTGNNGTLTFTFNNDLSEVSGNTEGNSGTNQQEPVATCPADFDTHNGCQSCENGVVSYAAEGTHCGTSPREYWSACNGGGLCQDCPPSARSQDSSTANLSEKTSVAGCYCNMGAGGWDGSHCAEGHVG